MIYTVYTVTQKQGHVMPKKSAPAKPSAPAAAKRPSKRASTKTKWTPAVVAKPSKHRRASKTEARSKKNKMVRDSFNMPESEYSLIAAVKRRCIAQGLAVKKSEVLRAAIFGFASQSDEHIKASMEALEVIKTGRPSKGQR